MAPAPEQVAESPAPPASDAHRSLPTPFLTKTYQLVDDPAVDDIVSWNADGSTFVVWRPAEFAREILPKYFKHNNFSSFVRQLNTYGFRKIVSDRWEFSNECFRRGEKRLLCDIHRRKVQPPAAVTADVPMAIPVALPANAEGSPTNSGNSSNSSPGAAPSSSGRGSVGSSSELMEENHRFRLENDRLNQELSQLKGLCNDILLLMSNYAKQQQNQDDACTGTAPRDQTPESSPSPQTPPPPPSSSLLELMPLSRSPHDSEQAGSAGSSRENGIKPDEEGPSPRLFGVPIGQKRARGADDMDAPPPSTVADESPQHRRSVKVKQDPADPVVAGPPPDADSPRWRMNGGCQLPNGGGGGLQLNRPVGSPPHRWPSIPDPR